MDFSKYFEEEWYSKLKHYTESKEFEDIAYSIGRERKKNFVIPIKDSDLFLKVFRIVPYNNVKVVILGQDPYHGVTEGIMQYDGLAFSNSTLERPQPSLQNILEEVESDIYDGLNLDRITNFSLYSWAEQGVLLTNAAHTVVRGSPLSHMKYWRDFTIEVVKALNYKDNIVWMLWGRFAQSFEEYITNTTHRIIKTSHPSPFSNTTDAPIAFTGSGCFSKCNQYLKQNNIKEIIW